MTMSLLGQLPSPGGDAFARRACRGADVKQTDWSRHQCWPNIGPAAAKMQWGCNFQQQSYLLHATAQCVLLVGWQAGLAVVHGWRQLALTGTYH